MNEWIPVIGVIAGVALGFITANATNLINHKIASRNKKKEQKIERLERLYRELQLYRTRRHYLSGELLDYFSGDKNRRNATEEEINSPKEIKMIIKMYFPELEAEFESLYPSQVEHARLHFEIAQDESRINTTEDKMVLFEHFKKVDIETSERISAMEEAIIHLIKKET